MSGARRTALPLLLAAVACADPGAPEGGPLYRSDAFTVTDTSVEQGRFLSVALGRDHLVSNYERAATEVNFKFSLNGLENEFPPGLDHMIYLVPRDGRLVTRTYVFGEPVEPATPEPELAADAPEEGPVEVTFRLDLRAVLDGFRTDGSYDPPAGPPIESAAFEGVYVIGNRSPLSWDFARLRPGAPVELTDPDGDGVYEVTLTFEAEFARPLTAEGLVEWRGRPDLEGFPASSSPHRLPDALYRLALEEVLDLTRPDGAIDAGGRWPGVWTRDLAWQTLLGLVFAAPDAVRAGLLARIDSSGRILQDSGSGGSWPISTDRVSWALAAWELYALEGDTAWLRRAFEVVRRSAGADLAVARDSTSGLFRGESTFLDWRDQSYPRWMDPRDISRSEALGTNALHYGAYRVLARMAHELGEPPEPWERIADEVRQGIDRHLWQPERGHHAQYRYGRLHAAVSPRAEHLGEALTAVLGVSDQARIVRSVESTPVVPFGVPSFWPYIPGVPPYHNAGVWPQVIGFRAWAAAEAGNAAAVEHALANLYRGAALFLTHKENWVAATGHFEGTEVNSDRFAASVAAQLGAVYRVLFGLRLEPDRLELRPFVPRAWAGTRTLAGLRYRDAVLTVIVHGFGNEPARVLLDGERVERAEVPAALTGEHTIEITLDGALEPGMITLVENVATPATPVARLEAGRLAWDPVADAERYLVVVDGEPVDTVPGTTASLEADGAGGVTTGGADPATADDAAAARVVEVQVQALGAGGFESFLSEPVRWHEDEATVIVEPFAPVLRRSEPGHQGAGYADVRDDSTTVVAFSLTVPSPGVWALDARYANGHGAVSYGHRTAMRTLVVDGRAVGTLVLPQRGIRRWDDWGYGSPLLVTLEAGTHAVTLEPRPENRNMDGRIDGALLDHLRATRIGG